MWYVKQSLLLSILVCGAHALICRSEGGPKESEIKTAYTKCLKKPDGKNSTRDSADLDWKENHRTQRNDWDQMGSDRGRNKENTGNKSGRRGIDGRIGTQNDRLSNDDRMGNYDHRSDSYDRMGNRDSMMGSNGRSESGGRDDSMGNNRFGREENINGGNDFQQNYGSDFSDQYGYQSTQSSRRFKRERNVENSGKRSQFNPNTKRYHDVNRSDEKDSSMTNTSKDDETIKACALHCYLESLGMTAEDGMPDRYLMTHTVTKNVTDEDLKDFVQEAIEECFQILDNDKKEDKCEFSKILVMCLIEKARENCDDWKDTNFG